jgi:hypothetical protein
MTDTTKTGLKALGEIFLLGGGASIVLTLLIYAGVAATPTLYRWAGALHEWYTTWPQRRIETQCAAHNGVDLSPYHVRTLWEEHAMALCLERHRPR